jgi:ribose transport system permease protein
MNVKPATSLQDGLLRLVVRFFRADWSGALLAILILAVSIELATTGKPFFHPSNLMTILNNAAAIGIVAGGMTLVILTAGIDLSVGSVMGMTAALTGYVASYWGFPPFMAILFGLGLGALIGLFHGTLIAKLGMPAFIVTLAGLSIWRGAGHLSTGAQATPKLPETFDAFGRYNPLSPIRDAFQSGDLPGWLNGLGRFIDDNWMSYFRTFQMSMIIFIVFFILLSVIVSNTIYGRYIYAIGSNESGARQAGINTVRYKMMTYIFCSTSAAFGALLFLGRAPYAKSDYGVMWELDAIAAVVIGGTSLFGGRGTIWGTFLGVILLKLINNGLTLAQLNTFWQMVVTGAIILIAVGLDIVRQSRDPEAVRKFLAAVGSAMAFFTLMTPASFLLRGWISLLEHNSVSALRETGAPLAAGHNDRLLSAVDVEATQALVSANFWPSLLALFLMFLAALAVFRSERLFTLIAVAACVATGGVLSAMEFSNTVPFLVLGGVVLIGSLFVAQLFARAQALSER